MVNAKHDTFCYDSEGYQREIFDGNALFEAYKRAKKGSDWKPQVQRFEMTYLLELSRIQREFTDFFRSWFKNHYKIMSRYQRNNIETLFNQLKEVTLCSTQSDLQTEGS